MDYICWFESFIELYIYKFCHWYSWCFSISGSASHQSWELSRIPVLKVKNDHRSKFSNLSNWKEEAWKKKSGLQQNSHPKVFAWLSWWSSDSRSSESKHLLLPLKPWFFFFRLLLSSCLNWKFYCDDHSSLLSTTAVQKWIISYILHINSCIVEESQVSCTH